MKKRNFEGVAGERKKIKKKNKGKNRRGKREEEQETDNKIGNYPYFVSLLNL